MLWLCRPNPPKLSLAMYAAVQSRLEGLRSQAASHHYTQAALTRFDEYKERIVKLHADTTTRVQERREALLSVVQGHKDAAVAAVRERRDAAAEKVADVKQRAEGVKNAAVEAVAARKERAMSAVSSMRASTEDCVSQQRARLSSSAERLAETLVGMTIVVVGVALSLAVQIVAKARATAPVAAVSAAERGVAAIQPIADRTLAVAGRADERVTGGLGSVFVKRVADGVSKRQADAEPAVASQ